MEYRCTNPECRMWTNDSQSRPCPVCGAPTFPSALIIYPDDEQDELSDLDKEQQHE